MYRASAVALIASALLLLAGCKQEQGSAEKAITPSPGKSAVVAERVEGTSPYKVMLTLDPAQPVSQKPVTFRFTVTDLADKPATGLDATVALVMPIMDMGKNEFVAKETSPGVYEGGGAFGMDDEWEVFLTLKKGKQPPAKHVFNVRVAE